MLAGILCMVAASMGAFTDLGSSKVVPFPRTYGNHRVRVRVEQTAQAVAVNIHWIRHIASPSNKDVIVTDKDGHPIANRVVVKADIYYGIIVFQPSAGPGVYYIYYLPYTTTGWEYSPTITYTPPKDTADATWKTQAMSAGVSALPTAVDEGVESRTEFDRFSSMEVPTTPESIRPPRACEGLPYAVFPEDRLNPIIMTEQLPLRWTTSVNEQVSGKAKRGEFFAFQLGVWASKQDLSRVTVKFSYLKSNRSNIPAAALRCINTSGVDWLGKAFSKIVDVPQGKVQALWCGLDVPLKAEPGKYTGTVEVKPANASSVTFPVEIEIENDVAVEHGDNDLKSMSRLKWLDSKIGLDDEVVAPFTPLKVKGLTVSCIQRKVKFSETGFPEQIVSKGHNVLASPIDFIVSQNGQPLKWKPEATRELKHAPATLEREVQSTAGDLTMTCRYKMEADGYVNYVVQLKSKTDVNLEDIRLEIPYRKDSATYFTGLGIKGGYRPHEVRWKWEVARANNMFWFGDVESGMQCKLKTAVDAWDLYSLGSTGLPDSWHNGGNGGCSIDEVGDSVVARAFSGKRTLKAGKSLEYKFSLLITPVKPLNPSHWSQRYEHISNWSGGSPKDMTDLAKKDGATIINIHQGNMLNPFINYPFATADQMAKYVAAAHEQGMKAKIYYTVRELSNRVAEMWPLRSLGYEIFPDGQGGGDSWLQEHLGNHYATAWHTPLADGAYDAAIQTVGLSRWHNYYLEGLGWLIKNVGIDGLYLDGIGYDREIMKRVRKVMDRAKPGCLLDFHSGNNFDPAYGLNSCVSGYMEHFPYVDSLWFGEGFNYNESPDYWLVEVSGIPFGLYGEMLQNEGNPWRGVVYGMTARYYSGADPKHIWKLWDNFGIAKAKMLGYWAPNCPVKTSSPDVLATAYVKKGKTLIALGSWAKTDTAVRLKIDWNALGLDPSKVRLTAPAVQGFQPAGSFGPDDAIAVEKGKGLMLIVSQNTQK